MDWIRIVEPAPRAPFNFRRKIWHMLGLIVPVAFYLHIFNYWSDQILHATRFIALLLMIPFLGVVLAVDYLRLRRQSVQDFFLRVAGPLMKQEELGRFNATVPYIFANIVLFLFFSREIVILGSILLMIGDPVAALVGIRMGRIRFWNGKSLEGLLGFILAGFLGGLLFLTFHSLLTGTSDTFSLYHGGSFNLPLLGLLFTGSVLAALGEFFSDNWFFGLIDDNLIVPLTGAIGMALFGLYAAGFPSGSLFFNPRHLCDFNILCDSLTAI